MTAFARLPLDIATPPMEAKAVDALPEGAGWQYEPKWDGFRCLFFREGAEVALMSKAGKPLQRFFPEVAATAAALPGDRLVLDGELIIPIGEILSFDALQMRLHPAQSRIRRLAAETPAQLMLFDMLACGDERIADRPLHARRTALERFHREAGRHDLLLSPCTQDREVALSWLDRAGAALDGVVAKRRDAPYAPGERAMLKVKRLRTADCVVGGFRYARGGRTVGSLLLGLFNDEGALDHVGFTASIPARERAELTAALEGLRGGPGFTGRAPGGPSRWATDRSADWHPLHHRLVAEVRYDHVTGDRFRHAAGFLRWRPDKAPEQCRIDQLQPEARPAAMAADLAAAKP
jgi:ATP-dependent DNA ligase